jgi:hypothetical protein
VSLVARLLNVRCWPTAARVCLCADRCPARMCSWLVAKLCGARGERAVDSCSAALCERKTPALQLVYLALVGYT